LDMTNLWLDCSFLGYAYHNQHCWLLQYVCSAARDFSPACCSTGRIDGTRNAARVTRLRVARLRQAWRGLRLIVHGDSGFRRQQATAVLRARQLPLLRRQPAAPAACRPGLHPDAAAARDRAGGHRTRAGHRRHRSCAAAEDRCGHRLNAPRDTAPMLAQPASQRRTSRTATPARENRSLMKPWG